MVTSSPKRDFDAASYIHIDWGPSFDASQRAAFSNLGNAAVAIGDKTPSKTSSRNLRLPKEKKEEPKWIRMFIVSLIAKSPAENADLASNGSY